jgi:hypothetical protein
MNIIVSYIMIKRKRLLKLWISKFNKKNAFSNNYQK